MEPIFERILVIFLENQPEKHVHDAPYLDLLKSKGVFLSSYFGIRHPSQLNYVAVISGSTFGMPTGKHGDDDQNFDQTTIVDLLEAKGISWKGYLQDLPDDKMIHQSDRYVRKHNPFASFTTISARPSRMSHVVNAKEFSSDLQSNALPQFCWYTPNLDNDGHDTGISFAGQWLQSFLDPLLANEAFMAETLVVVTFDERHPDADNHVYAVVLGPGAMPGSIDDTRYDHYSVLRTVEENWSLGTLGRNDRNATWFSFLWGLPPTETSWGDHN